MKSYNDVIMLEKEVREIYHIIKQDYTIATFLYDNKGQIEYKVVVKLIENA